MSLLRSPGAQFYDERKFAELDDLAPMGPQEPYLRTPQVVFRRGALHLEEPAPCSIVDIDRGYSFGTLGEIGNDVRAVARQWIFARLDYEPRPLISGSVAGSAAHAIRP